MSKPYRLPALAATLALAALLAGCSLPPYDEDLSLALISKSKMQRVSSIGPVYTWLEDSSFDTDFYFLPDRNDPASGGGFFVNTASYGLRVWYLPNGSGSLSSSWSIAVDNASDVTNNYLLQPIKSAIGVHYLGLLRYEENDYFQVFAEDLYPGSIYANGPTPLSSIFPARVLGSSIFPDSAAASNLQYFLCKTLPSGPWAEVQCTVTESGAVANASGPAFNLTALPDSLTSVFYGRYHDVDPTKDRGYLSFWSSSAGEYRSYSWGSNDVPAPTPGLLSGVKGRIDAVLTTGKLLSFENGACTVYSAAGKKLYRFPLGGLRFCYERWDNVALEFKLYFSLAYWKFADKDGQDELFLEVYAIPTADLADLD